MDTLIGFTTGSLYQTNIPLSERIKLYSRLGATAIELSFTKPNELLSLDLFTLLSKNLQKYDLITIHAPWKEVRYNSDYSTNKIIDKLRVICETIKIGGIVLHPNKIDDFSMLNNTELPFILENMDGRKTYGITLKQFKEFKTKYNFGFVLDLQHVYEHDPSMNLATELIDLFGDKLHHLHVSGQNSEFMHAPTYCSENKKEISKVLEKTKSVPKILEGILLEDIDKTISRELDFIRNF